MKRASLSLPGGTGHFFGGARTSSSAAVTGAGSASGAAFSGAFPGVGAARTAFSTGGGACVTAAPGRDLPQPVSATSKMATAVCASFLLGIGLVSSARLA